MAILKISQFSCVESAELELGTLTVLIGPQASGKSIVCKLVYFFYNILDQRFFTADEEKDWNSFSSGVVFEFKKWFPPLAWGKKRFSIVFIAGPVTMSLTRTISGNRPGKNIKFTVSDYVRKQFEDFRKIVTEQKTKLAAQKERVNTFSVLYRMERLARQKFSKDLGRDYFPVQTFVPAGRSFFTSIGKAVAAFEQGGFLDPLTISFGRFFTSLRDQSTIPYALYMNPRRSVGPRRQRLMRQFFGGDIKIDRESEYVETDDGRRLSFSLLSSGQQELLPLWIALDYLTRMIGDPQLTYIEEPEAHLFPTAQNALVAYLVSLLTVNRRTSLIVTTHSPYVLSKINNLLKAGSLTIDARKERRDAVAKIIPQESWLKPSAVRAYAVIGGVLTSILLEDGLIDGEYLDNVSGEVAREYSQLLDIEFGK